MKNPIKGPVFPGHSPSSNNFEMVRQEKLSQIEGESPSSLNMNDNTKT